MEMLRVETLELKALERQDGADFGPVHVPMR
jgi:hypothetical protein